MFNISDQTVGITRAMKVFVIDERFKTQIKATQKAISHLEGNDQEDLFIIKHKDDMLVVHASEASIEQEITVHLNNDGQWVMQ